MEIIERTCLRCGHNWLPRSDKKPVLCPSCKSKYWDQDRTEKGKLNEKW
jgi:predicted Zn-ribbon and HTH transcriptional regulator